MTCKTCSARSAEAQCSAEPQIVPEGQWRIELASLRADEKSHTRQGDALAARRRRLPMVKVLEHYHFEGGNGPVKLEALFGGRRQLIVYHFMFAPDDDKPCPGCSRRLDDVGELHHLYARQTSFAVVARAPYQRLTGLWQRKGWTCPVYSSFGSSFNADMGVTTEEGEDFGISVFFRGAQGIYRSYFTTGRGVEPAGFRSLLDFTPFGRQEEWEESPAGWPQSPTHGWGSERDE